MSPPPGSLPCLLLPTHRKCDLLLLTNMSTDRAEVWQGTLALMILKTLQTMGPQHGYGMARRIEQISEHTLSVNYGTIYPALLKLEQEGYITSEWGLSDNGRRAKFYRLTKAGQASLATETAQWQRLTEAVGLILAEE